MDITTALAEAQRPEKVVPLCLRGDLRGEFEAAEAELTTLQRTVRTAPSLADGGREREIAERIEHLRQEMLAQSVDFRMRALGRRAWNTLVEAHQKPDDSGIDTTTFLPAIVRACLVDPVLTDEQWTTLLDGDLLTSAQFEMLSDAAWSVNRGSVDVPFSPAALRITSSSEPA